MQIGSNSSYNLGSSYSIKLNEKERLVIDEDPQSRALFEERKAKKEQDRDLKNLLHKIRLQIPMNLIQNKKNK